jgi:hypothetical protein
MKGTILAFGIALWTSVPLGARPVGDEPSGQGRAADRTRPAVVVSSQVTTWPQGGYHLDVSFRPPDRRVEIGGSVSGAAVRGFAKDLVFDIEGNEDDLDMRLRWVAGLGVRYWLTDSRSSAWVGLTTGIEEFRVRAEDSGSGGLRDRNGFIGLQLGYRWHPWSGRGLFLQPQIAVNVLVFRPDVREVAGTSYRLRSVHPSPTLALGWAF